MSPLVSHQVSSEELDNCARELIHQTPLLQPYGFLIACDVHTGLIVFASDNATQFLPAGPGGLLGRPIDEVVDGPFEDAWERVRSMHPGAPIALALRLRSCSPALECSEVIVHRAGDNVVIEAMPYRCAVSDVDIYIEFERVLGELGRLQRHVRTSDFL